ncbi:FAD-dependent oxidoreductase [Microbispora sp. NBRC 16548]|uniref:FAD-dependent oxidoreductase n=1 Tax=Microbispora sp. NBRC 16548 TaxID=3030994 RepID=UPI0024A3B295|nr:FAD-dependent oxidoreductase [Microbispora sp. NBRC 16548]GLX09014.1 UDP-galactopyranose mutase [Microbispora sp. NBRC 16548]
MTYDVVIVGAGLFGIVTAQHLAEHGMSIALVERDTRIGGLCRSERHSTGIEFCPYGTHVMATDDLSIWRYLSRFAEWMDYRHTVHALVDGHLIPMPIGLTAIRHCYGQEFDPEEARRSVNRDAAPYRNRLPATVEDVALASLGPRLYEMFVAAYVTKQWGVHPSQLVAEVFSSRFAIRFDDEDGYRRRRFEGLPADGYGAMFTRMVSSPLIDLYMSHHGPWPRSRHVCVYTGPLDAYFGHRYGKLARRRVALDWREANQVPGVPVTTHPDAATPHYRTHRPDLLPWNHAPAVALVGTERAGDGEHVVEFVLRTPANTALIRRYRELSDATTGVVFAGRGAGADFYLDMGQTVAAALSCAHQLVSRAGKEIA